jgi:hypothetical protein
LLKNGAIAFILIGFLIVSFVIYTLNFSTASQVAKEYIKANEEIKRSFGEIVSVGWTSTGKIEESQERGQANFSFELAGANKQGNITIYLIKNNSGWQVDKYELK